MKRIFKRLLARFGLYLTRGYTIYLFSNKKIVRRELYGKKVLMPRSHSIGYNLAHFPYYNSNLQRIVDRYQRYRKDEFTILDIGANIGDTLLMLRQVTSAPVRCFEGDPFYFRLLEANCRDISNCTLHPVLLSDRAVRKRVSSQINLGTSTFITDEAHGVVADFTSIDEMAGRHFSSEPVGVIKSDTDGYDLKIIRGATETIRKHLPVLFLEYDRSLFEPNGDDGLDFLQFLAGIGYSGLIIYDNFGKLLCITSLAETATLRSLHGYIKNQRNSFPFYDLAIFAERDQIFFEEFTTAELAFFEK